MQHTATTLFCIPHAGGNTAFYARFNELFPAWITIRPLELPGKGRRCRERLLTNMESMGRDLLEQIHPAAHTGPYALFGHSMGGHGALTLALRHPGRYASVSAFAPIVAPSQVPWGQKVFAAYLGDDRAAWAAHDAVALVATARERLPLLVDQGEDDEFLPQLQPELLRAACSQAGHPLTLRLWPGYDHSYYFIASFIGEHVAHHARALRA